jgi:hypothetical protein
MEGMELFRAADDQPLNLLRRVIDECNYYIMFITGRCGSIDKEGIGFTEMERDYAIS